MDPRSPLRQLDSDPDVAPSVGYARMSGCVLIVDGAGRVERADSGTRALLGMRPVEAEGMFLHDLLSGIHRDTLRAALDEAGTGRVVERNARTDHAGHIAIWFVRHAVDPVRIAVLGRDLSVINELLLTVEEKQQLAVLGHTAVSAAREVRDGLEELGPAGQALASPDLAPGERSAQAGQFQKGLRMATEAVGRLLDVAHGWEDLDERFELREVVQEVLQLKLALLQQEGIRLDEKGVGIPTWVRARRRSTRTAVLTLLGNAIHALSRNPSSRPRSLRVAYEVLGSRYVSLVVEDTAGGLPLAIQEEVFEGDNPHGVYALGLLRARSIARDGGGALLLDNQPGQGARFTLLLPRAP